MHSTLDGDDATNQILDSRLFTVAQAAARSADVSTERPVKTGNRPRNGLNSRCGVLFPLNRPDGQDGHTESENWLGSLWRRLALALLSQAESENLIHRMNRKEKVSVLSAGNYCGRAVTRWCKSIVALNGSTQNVTAGTCQHSGHYAFLFSFTLGDCNSHMKRTGNTPPFSWGSYLVFCFLVFFYAGQHSTQ